ncbi:reverse transcriptase domain-containing protein [Tanacetum coccineum]
MELCDLLKSNLDIFAWKPTNMTGVRWFIAEHRLNICEGCPPTRQKKTGQAPNLNKVIQEEVTKLVEAQIMREVHYHNWLSNPIIVKKHDNSWLPSNTYGRGGRGENRFPYKSMSVLLHEDALRPKERRHNIPAASGQSLQKADWEKFREAVIKLQSPRTLKEVQSLNEKLASLNRFLSKSAEKSLPFFKTLKKCIKKSDFQWMAEAEKTFQEMKQCIVELPMLTAPKPKEELIMYLCVAREAISAVLLTERNSQQMPNYFVSRALHAPKINYSSMEKLVLALVHT